MRNRMCRGSSSTIGHRTSGRFRKLAKLMLATAPIAGALFAGGNAFAQSQLTWAPAGADGSGNWDTSTPNWNPGQVDWVNGDSAIFGSGGAAGTVTLQAPIQAVSLTFNSVASGDYLITGSGTNTLTLLSGQSILSNITDGVGPSIGATIAGSSGLTLIGAGTLNLTGNNTYTGTTSIGSGTLIVSSTGNLGAITNALSIGTPTNAGGSVTSVGNLTLNSSQTVGGVNVSNNSSGTDSLVLNSTTLTVNGGFNVGFGTTTGTAQTSSLIVSGGGSLVVNGSMDIGGQGTSTNKAVSTTSLAGINSFTLNAGSSGSLLIGDGGNIKALLTLANSGSNSSNTITAGSIIIGQSGGSNANAGCALELGGGTNVIDVNTMTIGQGKSAGSMGFPSNAANGVVTIAPISGTGTNITIGDETSGTASSTASSILLAGHTANVTAGTVIVGEQSGDTGGNPGAQMTFDTGNFTMSALELGVMGPNATSATGGSYSFTLGSTASSTGRLTIGTAGTNGTFYLGNISGTGNSTAANTSTNTFNMVGGTANIFANIASTYSSTAKGTAIPILILSGGTLNMEGNNIGTVASGNGFITTNFVPVATQSATLENLGANGINLSGLTLNGAGTLVLEGNNTYTGGTKINSGTLQIGEPTDATGLASSMGTGAVTVGSALTFASSQAVIVGNAIGGGGVINQSGTGLTTLNGSNSFSGNVNVSGGNLSVTGSMTAATTNLSGGVLSGTGVLGNINHSAGAIVPATGLNLLGTLSANNYTFSGGTLAFNIGTSSSSMLDVANATFNAIPNFSFNLVGAPAAGSTFTLVQSASAIADNGNLGSLPASTVGRTTYTPFEQGGPGGTDIDVVVSGGPASLIWNNTGGTGDGLTWDVQTNQNWFNTGTAAADVFYDADNVTFNDNNNGHYTVAVEQTVTPGSVTFANGSNAYTVSGAAISSDGALNVTGTGGVSLSNSSTFASVAINAGSLTIAASGELDSPTVNVAAGSSLTIASGATLSGSPALSDNGSVSITTAASTTVSSLNGGGTFAVAGTLVDSAGGSFSGSITDNSGSGSLSVSGGTLSLSGSNTYSGGTSVSSGALLVIASGGSLNPATTLTDAGTVNLQNAAQTISTLNGAGALNLLGDTLTVSNGGTFSGHIADGGAGEVGNIIAAGGTLTLSGTNAYSGTTEVKSGALLKPIGNFALGTGTTVNVDSGGTIDIGGNAVANTVNFGNDVFNISGTGVNGEGALYNSASGITQEDAYNYITLTGNALIGGYRADVGRNVTNGSLNLNGFTLTTNIIGTTNTIFAILNDATVSNGMIIADSPATGTNAGLDFERGAIAGPGVSVIYEPNSSAQFYELAAGSGGGVTAQLTFMGGNFIGNGGSVLSTLPASIILDGNVTFEGMTSGVPTAASTFALTVTGSISDDGNHRSITKLSPNTLTLSGINTWGGATLIQNGDIVLTASSALPANTPLTLGAAATSGQLDLNGNSVSVGSLATSGTGTTNDITSSSAATLTFNGGSSTFGGALNNALALNVGSGSLELTGNNNYSGGTTINGGTLQLGSASAMGSTSAPLTVNAGTLDLNGNSPTVGSLSGTGGTIDEVSAGGNVSLTVNQSGTTSFAGSIQNTTGSVALNFNGGSLALTGTNSYTGLTSVNSGQLEIDNPVFMSSQVNVGGSATLALNAVEYGSNTVNSGQITAIQSGPGKITGNISGNGSFNQNGGGPTILFGTNTYTGNTNVNAGELVIGAASALSAATSLTVGSTNTAMAQLGTTGVAFTVSGVTVNSGSTLDLTSNSLTVNYGGSDPVSTIASYLADGFHSGWAAGEINSSSVASLNASQSKLIYSVGYADGADGITNVPSGEIEILPTLAGDAKMQGNVVFGDFQLLSQYFGQSGTSWDEGDFTYNGTTNFGDFQLLSQNFGQNSSALTGSEVASINSFAAQFGEAYVPSGSGYSLVSVPEPASVGLLVAAGLGLMSRRRRKPSAR